MILQKGETKSVMEIRPKHDCKKRNEGWLFRPDRQTGNEETITSK